jgi:hypothetical protein
MSAVASAASQTFTTSGKRSGVQAAGSDAVGSDPTSA